jgi:hypothetical protein
MAGFNFSGRLEFNNLTDLLENTTNGLYYWLETVVGWTLHNAVSSVSGATDKIFKSTGEDGTEVIYIRLTQTGTEPLYFRTATFYAAAPAAATAQNETGVNSSNWNRSCWNAAPLTAWFSGDRDSFAIATLQSPAYANGGNMACTVFGRSERMIPGQYSGRTTLTADTLITTAGTTTLPVGDSSNITIGQKLFVINTADTGNRGNLLRCTVTGIPDPTNIDVTSDYVTADVDFDAGALVGLEPMPTFIPRMDNSSANSYGFALWRGFCYLYNPTTIQMSGAAQSNPPHNVYWGPFFDTEIQPVNTDYHDYANPDANWAWPVSPLLLIGTWDYAGAVIAGGKQMRGKISRVCTYPMTKPLTAWGSTMRDGAVTYMIAGYRSLGTYASIDILIRTVA